MTAREREPQRVAQWATWRPDEDGPPLHVASWEGCAIIVLERKRGPWGIVGHFIVVDRDGTVRAGFSETPRQAAQELATATGAP